MIPKQENVKVFSNSTNEKGFTINASREAFRILSSGLYSNKIQAIVRELSCNAYDSHVMAGTPERPFKIHIPDAWEPWFSVEDFGIGLDDDDINNIYTTYFSSTKTSSNDVIGGLGLGSKTPFSYTDTFTVRARKDSVERVYSAYISEAGSPTVSLMSEEDTEEPNGVLVSLPVKTQDFYNFEKECHNVFKFFKTLPEFNNEMTVDNSVVTELDDKDGLIINTNRYNAGNVLAVMGNVAYSFKVTDTIVDTSHTRIWSFLKETSMTVRFNIGDISVAANRETLSFDEESKQTFIDKLQEISEGFYQKTQDRIDSECSNIFEVISVVQEEVGAWGYNLFTFNGEPIDQIVQNNVFQDIVEVYDPEGDLDSTTFLYKLNHYDRMVKTQLVEKNYSGDRRFEHLTYSKAAQDRVRFLFVMDDSEHHRGLDHNTRAKLRMLGGYAIAIHKVLTEEEKEKIENLLEGRPVVFANLVDLKEEFKIIRAKNREEDGEEKVRKIPVARVKKNEVRIRIWENNKEEDQSFHTPRLIDIDELKDKKVGFLVTDRGDLETVFRNYLNDNPINAMYICKVFGLDALIVANRSKHDYYFEKMPFMVEVKDLMLKDVKDNEFALVAALISNSGYGFRDLEKFDELKIRQIFYSEIFESGYLDNSVRYGNDVRFIDHYAKFDPEYVQSLTDDLYRKYTEVKETLTDKEIHLSSGCFEIKHNYPMFKMLSILSDAKTKEIYEKSVAFLDKYVLIRPLVSMLHGIGIEEHCIRYVQLIDKDEKEKELLSIGKKDYVQAVDEELALPF